MAERTEWFESRKDMRRVLVADVQKLMDDGADYVYVFSPGKHTGYYHLRIAAKSTPAIEPCSCGDRKRPGVNHRKRIPCWTYLGHTRYDLDERGRVLSPPFYA
jgi:hypothetical protein